MSKIKSVVIVVLVITGLLLIFASYYADNYEADVGWWYPEIVFPCKIFAYPLFIFGVTSLFASAITFYYSRYDRLHP